MTSYALLLAAELRRDLRKRRDTRRVLNQYTDYVPPATVEQWIVVEISELTGTVLRYWRGTDRDHWHKIPEHAAVFRSERMARICQTEFMVGDYYPRSRIIQLQP